MAYIDTQSKTKAVKKAQNLYGKGARVFKQNGAPASAKILDA